MATEFHFNQLDPTSFQRLINAVLTTRFGEPIRLLPLRGRDGGRDAEIPADYTAFTLPLESNLSGVPATSKGTAIFQVKHHRTIDGPILAARNAVVGEFEEELQNNVLPRAATEEIAFFFLVTNVPGSRESFEKVDQKRQASLGTPCKIYADVLWGEHVTAWLDQYPHLWPSFPDLFAGKVVPGLGNVAANIPSGFARSCRLALQTQFQRDRVVRFRQIELEEKLSRLFVDLDTALPETSTPELTKAFAELEHRELVKSPRFQGERQMYFAHSRRPRVSCVHFFGSEDLTEDRKWPRKVILEGGPGQGKSTVTQMLAQVYRSMLLDQFEEYAPFCHPERARLPFRIELRLFAEWLKANDGTVEQYIAQTMSKDAGGAAISVEGLQTLIEGTPIIIIFDGLDEVGSDELRDAVLVRISEAVERFEALERGVRVILTTRPPAIAGKGNRLPGFVRLQLLPLEAHQVDQYISKWTEVLCTDADDQERIVQSFNKRRNEVHVRALATNPMQLSVLLQFIRLKGEAFPDRRAELYKDYFRTVIDRDIEKTPRLLSMRADIEALHEVIGFRIHSLAESTTASASLSRNQLIGVVEQWLRSEDRDISSARELFRLGEERLGLIIALAGEAGQTRYGFEIQPVREYFAAAYINERIPGNAHDFFQGMVRRPFWREVALFLAGLRRSNEKADLLLRAKSLDEDPKLGWRQDGTSTILELLQEGVLASPGHVHRDSVSFVLRLLDPKDNAPKNEPKALHLAIPNLIRNSGSQLHLEQLRRFLLEGSTISDRGAIERLHRVAYKVLDHEFLREHLSASAGEANLLSARTHISLPRLEKVDLCEISKSPQFWPRTPDPIWASEWFRTTIDQPEKGCLAADPSYHQLLVEQFACSSISPKVRTTRECDNVEPVSKWGVWWLRYYIQRLCDIVSGRVSSVTDIAQMPTQIDYIGLEQSVAVAMREILETCIAAIDALRRDITEPRTLSDFLNRIEKHLSSDGLAGWVACRCAVSMLETSVVRARLGFEYAAIDPDSDEIRYYLQAPQRKGRLLVKLGDNEAWAQVRRSLTPYFEVSGPGGVDTATRSRTSRIVSHRLSELFPPNIRIDGEMVSVLGLLQPRLRQKKLSDGGWIDRIPIPQWWFRALVSHGADGLEVLLAEIARRHSRRGPHVPMSIQAMRRVIAFAKGSSDVQAVAGSLTCLIGSKFWSLLDNAILLKMIEADSKCSDIAWMLFEEQRNKASDMSRMLDLAQAILDGSGGVSRNTGTAAAAFCAQNLPVNFEPLTSAVNT